MMPVAEACSRPAASPGRCTIRSRNVPMGPQLQRLHQRRHAWPGDPQIAVRQPDTAGQALQARFTPAGPPATAAGGAVITARPALRASSPLVAPWPGHLRLRLAGAGPQFGQAPAAPAARARGQPGRGPTAGRSARRLPGCPTIQQHMARRYPRDPSCLGQCRPCDTRFGPGSNARTWAGPPSACGVPELGHRP
jgi:hypothetical protein